METHIRNIIGRVRMKTRCDWLDVRTDGVLVDLGGDAVCQYRNLAYVYVSADAQR